LVVALALALLCGCGEAGPEESATSSSTEAVTTTQESTTLDPNRPKAMMEPVQGGLMLYPFPGREEGCYGLINQDGEVVAEPQFADTAYVHKAQGRVIGLIACEKSSRKYIHFDLQGNRRELNCGGYSLGWRDILADGRYMIVYTAIEDEWDFSPIRPGLFDIENDAWVIAPKEAQAIKAYKDRVLVHAADSTYEYYLGDGSTRKLPDHCEVYLEEAGWYRTDGWGDWKYYDTDLKPLPQLDGCLINPGMDGDDVYFLVYTYWNGLDTALVDRSGKFIDTPYSSLDSSGQCWMGRDGADENAPEILLDRNLKPIYTLKEGEEFILIAPLYGSVYPAERAHLVQNAKGEIVKAFDKYGKALQSNGSMQRFGAVYDHNHFTLENGSWSKSEGIPYENRPEGEDFAVYTLVTTEDYRVIWAGWEYEDESVPKKIYAIDWDGNPLEDCPLAPFFKNLENYFESAGEQGPNYYWVELDGKRGYVDAYGNWLFIRES